MKFEFETDGRQYKFSVRIYPIEPTYGRKQSAFLDLEMKDEYGWHSGFINIEKNKIKWDINDDTYFRMTPEIRQMIEKMFKLKTFG